MRAAFGERAFQTVIPYTVRAKESVVTGQSILDYDPKSRLAESYWTLAEEILTYVQSA